MGPNAKLNVHDCRILVPEDIVGGGGGGVVQFFGCQLGGEILTGHTTRLVHCYDSSYAPIANETYSSVVHNY